MAPIKDFLISNKDCRINFSHTSHTLAPVKRIVNKLVREYHEKNHHKQWSRDMIPSLELQQYYVGDDISMRIQLCEEVDDINPVGRKYVKYPTEGTIVISPDYAKPIVRKSFFNTLREELNKI